MNLKLTKKALEEKDKLTAKEITSINFSKMAVGSGLYTSEELTNDITELRSVEITTEIADVYQEMVNGESQLFTTSTFFNEDVEETFEVREVGIYAISNKDEKEYLYAYYLVASTDIVISIIQDKSLPQYIPISVNTKLSNIDQVNITIINDMLVVNQDEYKRYKVDIKEYIDEEDTKIENIVNTKADLIHGHGLTDENITGILPIANGGTGKSNGDADFNTLRVKSLFINDKPSPRAGMPSYDTPATQILSISGYTNRDFTITEDAWYRVVMKGGGVESFDKMLTSKGFFIRYLVAGTICKLGSGSNASYQSGGGYPGGGGSATVLINEEVFDSGGGGAIGGGGSAGGGGGGIYVSMQIMPGGSGGYGGLGGGQSGNPKQCGLPGTIGFPFGSGGGAGYGGGAGGGRSGNSNGFGGGLFGGSKENPAGGIGARGSIAGIGGGGGLTPDSEFMCGGISMNLNFLCYESGNGFIELYKINW